MYPVPCTDDPNTLCLLTCIVDYFRDVCAESTNEHPVCSLVAYIIRQGYEEGDTCIQCGQLGHRGVRSLGQN
jgi:hypothetical protein